MACLDCEDCHEQIGISCYGFINLITGVTANTAYTVFIEDKHGAFYTQSVTSDVSGDVSIDTSTLEEGLFHAHSGNYKVTVSTNALVSTEETLTIEGDAYTCIQLKFVDVE